MASTLSSASSRDIDLELRRRRKYVEVRAARCDRLIRKVEKIQADIAAHGGMAVLGKNRKAQAIAGRRRPKNDANLVQSLGKTLAGKTMSVTEVTGAVQKAGYRTTSPNFRTIVNQTLINNPGKFKRVSRGQYTAK